MPGCVLKSCTAFSGSRRIASGDLIQVTKTVKESMDSGGSEAVLIFDDLSGETVEVDFRGTALDVVKRLEASQGSSAAVESKPMKGPGRPKLGVVSREVTLLPRHWAWLNEQSGGASVTLRRLVDEARHSRHGRDRIRQAQAAAYRFMTTMAGNLPGYEEALRALFAGRREALEAFVAAWPADIREYALILSAPALREE
jgi:uncharacterized protein